MKKIIFFNHKGGVSKTTSVFHVGWMLARLGKKTLLVDADSQCNLTLFAMGEKRFEEFYSSKSKENIKDALKPAFDGSPIPIKAVECQQVEKNSNTNLFLLPGHIDFSEYETSVGVSLNLYETINVTRNIPGAFNRLLDVTNERYKFDYVLIDVNPSLSAFNQVAFTSSDYFIIPTSPDLFSAMAIRSLTKILPRWERWAEKARMEFSEEVYPFPKTKPKFLGYTVNDFKLKKGGEAAKSFRNQMNRIHQIVEGDFLKAIQEKGMILSDANAYKTAENKYRLENQKETSSFCIAEISDFNKLIAEANEANIPVFELSAERLHFEGQERTLKWFKRLYRGIAEKVIYLTSTQS